MAFSPLQIELKQAVKQYLMNQDLEQRLMGTLGIKKNGDEKRIPKGQPPPLPMTRQQAEVFTVQLDFCRKMMKNAVQTMDKVLDQIPFGVQLRNVRGVGTKSASYIISRFDIERSKTVSVMWRYAGLDSSPVLGWAWNKVKKIWVITTTFIRADKLTAGFRSPFNQALREELLGGLFGPLCNIPKKSNPYWYKKFQDYLSTIEAKGLFADDKKYGSGHRFAYARRWVMKQFILEEVYKPWRALEGLEVRPSFAEREGMGHHYGSAQEQALQAAAQLDTPIKVLTDTPAPVVELAPASAIAALPKKRGNPRKVSKAPKATVPAGT